MSTKKKILFRINTLRGGGAEKVLITILKYINYNKYEIDLLVNKKGYVYDNQIPEKVNFKFLFYSSNALSKSVFNVFYKLVREIGLSLFNTFPQLLYKLGILNKYDLEIAFLEDMAPFVAKSPNKNSKKIVWVHIDLLGLETLSNKKKLNICQSLFHYDEIIVVSDGVGEALLDLCIVLNLNISPIRSKIKTIYNPIDVEQILDKSKELIPIKKGSIPLLIAVGSLSIQKKFDRLIEAHKKLLQNSIPNKLIILGEGGMRKELEQLIVKLGVQNTVELLGFHPNPYPYIKLADIFVLPSDHEGYPLVLTEAIILGKAIIATEITGTTEMLANGKYGMLAKKSTESLYKGLKKLLTNKKVFDIHINKSQEGKSQFDCRQKINEIEETFDSN